MLQNGEIPEESDVSLAWRWRAAPPIRSRMHFGTMHLTVGGGGFRSRLAAPPVGVRFIHSDFGLEIVWRDTHPHGRLYGDGPKVSISYPTPFIGEKFQPPLQGVDEDENLNSLFALSGHQKSLLMGESVNNARNRNDRALEKRDRLPGRIRHFLDDVALLHHSALFSEDRWEHGVVERREGRYGLAERLEEVGSLDEMTEEGNKFEKSESERYETPYRSGEDLWEDLIDVPMRAQVIRDDVFFHGDPVLSKETQLGYEIGSAFQMVRPDGYKSRFASRWDYDGDISAPGLICGFILAFVGESQGDLDEERETMSSVGDLLMTFNEARKKEAKRMPTPDKISESQDSQAMEEGIEAAGISPKRIVKKEVECHHPGFSGGVPDSRFEEDTLVGAATSIIKEIKDVTPLEEIDSLHGIISEDIDTTLDRGASGIDSATIPLKVQWEYCWKNNKWDLHGPDEVLDDDGIPDKFTSQNIAAEIGYEQSQVSTVLNRISDHDSETWVQEEILVRDEKNRGSEWSLTPYGILLCYCLFQRDHETDWLYHFAIGPEELSLFERTRVSRVLESLDYV